MTLEEAAIALMADSSKVIVSENAKLKFFIDFDGKVKKVKSAGITSHEEWQAYTGKWFVSADAPKEPEWKP